MSEGNKTAILTFHDSDNFGSVLQSYATSTFLNKNGIETEILDLRKPEVERLYSIFKPLNCKSNLAANVYNSLNYTALKKRKRVFEDFRKEYLPLSEKRYKGISDIEDTHPDYKAYVVGSDQVWNVGIVDFDMSYLLPFADGSKRIAYAASGLKDCSEKDFQMMKPHLEKFDLITVRENRSVTVLKENADIDCVTVLDPVFLIDREDWTALAAFEIYNEPYMFCYFAGGVVEEFEKYTATLAKEMGVKRVLVMPEWKNFFRSGIRNYSSGPKEFLSLVANAQIVCTNSFHAAAFSVILNKPFVVGTNSLGCDERINTLLSHFDLSECEYDSEKKDYIPPTPDFDRVNTVLFESRKRCERLLLDALR